MYYDIYYNIFCRLDKYDKYNMYLALEKTIGADLVVDYLLSINHTMSIEEIVLGAPRFLSRFLSQKGITWSILCQGISAILYTMGIFNGIFIDGNIMDKFKFCNISKENRKLLELIQNHKCFKLIPKMMYIAVDINNSLYKHGPFKLDIVNPKMNISKYFKNRNNAIKNIPYTSINKKGHVIVNWDLFYV